MNNRKRLTFDKQNFITIRDFRFRFVNFLFVANFELETQTRHPHDCFIFESNKYNENDKMKYI